MKQRKEQKPPGLGTWLIERFGDSKEVSNMLGDLHELYQRRVKESGVIKARLYYWIDFISVMIHRPFSGNKKSSYSRNNIELLFNYFKVAVRNLARQKMHTGINVFGLSIGFAFSLLVFLYVAHELSYDTFHKNARNIYLLPMTWHFNGTNTPTSANCSIGGPFMESFPEVEKTVRLSFSSISFFANGEPVKEKNVLLADSTFFSIFDFPLLYGDSAKALTTPNSIVISRAMAEKYFGSDWEAQNVLGNEIVSTNNKSYTITGIAENPPSNSHIQFSFIISFSTSPASRRTPSWDNSEFYTYILLKENASVQKIKDELPERMDKTFGKETSAVIELDLVPLKDIYLHNPIYYVPNTSDVMYVRVFSFAAILVTLIATVNYINMATARSMERSLEVGVRKVMGAQRFQLFKQFLSESLIVTSASLLIAVGIAWMLLPYFNLLSEKALQLRTLVTARNVALFAGGGVLISLLAGIYPAFFVSGYNPAKVLKGKLTTSVKGTRLRESLVLIQFMISVLLIISTLMISDQMNFIQQKGVGYERKKLVALSMDSLSRTTLTALKTSINSNTIVNGSAACYQLPVNISQVTALSLKNEKQTDRKLMKVVCVDPDFAKTLGLQFATGNDINSNVNENSETWEILINQSAAKFFGWTDEEAVGKELKVWQVDGIIKGVVRDFHFSSLHSSITPLVLFSGMKARSYNYLLINTAGSPRQIQDVLESSWKKINNNSPFQLTFLDDQYSSLYVKETQLNSIVNIFSVLAIIISVLGLFGLASYSIVQRTKEFGIRKVLGATISDLITIVSGRFLRLIVVAFLLAVPLSWYLMNAWLSGFAYHISFSWLLVIVAGAVTIGLAMMTIVYHALQAANVNPSETLRAQ